LNNRGSASSLAIAAERLEAVVEETLTYSGERLKQTPPPGVSRGDAAQLR
jgi:hypothetical protein